MSMLTISLKLYSPGREKREIIDEALMNYSRAYQYLLDKAHDEIEYIAENYKDNHGRYKAAYIGKWIDKDISRELNKFHIEPFKDSLKIDFSTTLSGFLNLKKIRATTKYPVVYIWEGEFEEKYKELMSKLLEEKISPSKWENQVEKYIKKSTMPKPLYFCRCDTKRNFCLLHDDKRDRFFAKLYLMNTKNNKRRIITSSGDRELRYVYKDNEVFKSSGRKECFVLFPLSFGKWQDKYLKEAVDNPGMIKTARLIKQKDEYFLSINMDVDKSESIEVNTYMGISRSITNAVHYSIVNNLGVILKRGSGKIPDIREKTTDNQLHEVANLMVKTAKENKSQVIMQKFVDIGDRLQWKEKSQEHIPVLNFRDYNRLYRILEYKLESAGLPPPLRVSSAGIFYTCASCGTNTKKNRFSSNLFICTSCGFTMDVEYLGSFNLAKKLITYRNDTIKIKAQNISGGLKFINEDLGLDFYTSNLYHCMDELKSEIHRIVDDFYSNIIVYEKSRDFKRKLSLIKKIQQHDDISSLIKIVQ